MGKTGLEQAKQAIISYKTGQSKEMTPELWQAKKIVDSTLHPGMSFSETIDESAGTALDLHCLRL